MVAELPPMGCLPIQETLSFKDLPTRKCVEDQNSDSEAYNQKLLKLLKNLEAKLSGSTVLYVDIFTPIMDMVNNPHKYGTSENILEKSSYEKKINLINVNFVGGFYRIGFEQTNKGCCGNGLAEAGPLCNALTPTCKNRSKFVFWDSFHPTETAYNFITESLFNQIFGHVNRN